MWRTLLFQSQSARQSVTILGTISSSPEGCVTQATCVGPWVSSAPCHPACSSCGCIPERLGLEDLPQDGEVQNPSWVLTGYVLPNLCCLVVMSLERLPLPRKCSCSHHCHARHRLAPSFCLLGSGAGGGRHCPVTPPGHRDWHLEPLRNWDT